MGPFIELKLNPPLDYRAWANKYNLIYEGDKDNFHTIKTKLGQSSDRFSNDHYQMTNDYINYKSKKLRMALYNEYDKIHPKIVSFVRSEINDYSILQKIFLDILDLVDWDDIHNWVSRNISIPDKIPDAYIESTNSRSTASKDQTYIKSEYRDLATLSIVMKLLIIPITEVRLVLEGPFNQEMIPSRLTALFIGHKNINSDTVNRLMRYFLKIRETKITQDDVIKKDLVSVADEDRRIENEFGKLLIERVSVLKIYDDNAPTNAPSILFRAIGDIVTTRQGSGGIINKKPTGNEDGDEESFIEQYRGVTPISMGEVITINYMKSDLVYQWLSIPIDETTRSIEAMYKSFGIENTPDEVDALTAMVMSIYGNADAFQHLTNDGKEIIYTATLLWMLKYELYELAFLLTCTVVEEDTIRQRITAVVDENLYAKVKDLAPRAKKDDPGNMFFIDKNIDDMFNSLKNKNLVSRLRPSLKRKLFGNDLFGDMSYIVSPNFKNEMYKLIILIEEQR